MRRGRITTWIICGEMQSASRFQRADPDSPFLFVQLLQHRLHVKRAANRNVNRDRRIPDQNSDRHDVPEPLSGHAVTSAERFGFTREPITITAAVSTNVAMIVHCDAVGPMR